MCKYLSLSIEVDVQLFSFFFFSKILLNIFREVISVDVPVIACCK